jgi:hypothetical protein
MRTIINLITGSLIIVGFIMLTKQIGNEFSQGITNIEYNSELSKQVDPDLIPYVYNFINKAEKNGVEAKGLLKNLKIRYVDLSGMTESNGFRYYGYCFYSQGYVGIDPIIWKSKVMSELEKQQLVMHELGHCALGRLHDNEQQWDQKHSIYLAKSFMVSQVLKESLIIYKMDELEKELFDPTKFNQLAYHEGIAPDQAKVIFKGENQHAARN